MYMTEKRELEMRGKEILEELEGISGIFTPVNKTFLAGKMEKRIRYSHEYNQESFFKTKIGVVRNSGIYDYITVIISEKILNKYLSTKPWKGDMISVAGSFFSQNKKDNKDKSHLNLFLSAQYIEVMKDEELLEEMPTTNIIYLDGYICKEPNLRKTNLSNQYITDLLIATNRPDGKSDYIPCIVWNDMAKWARKLKVGEEVRLYGRIQSREFFKKFSQKPGYIDIYDAQSIGKGKLKMAYEVSVIKIQRFSQK